MVRRHVLDERTLLETALAQAGLVPTLEATAAGAPVATVRSAFPALVPSLGYDGAQSISLAD